ncbi:hypothetical protein M408DRAFT_31137, partial [Serendipita vermifera MAFF 305830]
MISTSSAPSKIYATDIAPVHSITSPSGPHSTNTLKPANSMTPDLLSRDELELLDRSDSLKPAGKKKRSRSHVDPNRTVSSVSFTHSTSYDTQLGGNTKGHTFQRPRASLIASTFRKLRGRRTTPAGEDLSVPALPDLSFLISAADCAEPDARARSLERGFLHPPTPLRSTRSDSNMYHHHSVQSYPPRELHDAEKQFHSSLPQHSVTKTPLRPPPLSIPRDVDVDSPA